jgi:hypothetical protein
MAPGEDDTKRAWVERVLGVTVPGAPGVDTAAADAPPQGIVAYRKALLEYGAARQTVAAQIEALRKKIPETLPHEAELADEVADEISAMNEEIGDAIDEAINTARDERASGIENVQSMIESWLAELDGDPLIQHVDANPFSPVTVSATLGTALRKIAATAV